MISSTVVPLGSDLSRGPCCARATAGKMMASNMITGSSIVRSATKGSDPNMGRAGRGNLITYILTKRGRHKKTNGSLHPQSRRAFRPFGGGGRLQFCLLDLMRQKSEG